jgi:DNA-directed RNA polymerase subunit alpha
LDFKGKGVITGSDIKCPSGFIVVNKDLIIANAENENSALKLEIYATRGIGFKTFNENRELINSLGIIATDSNFSPVVQVSYKVEEIKVEKTSFDDELTISIATNGSMTPEECLENASRILINQLNLFKFSTDEKYNVLNSNIAPSNKKTISTSIIELNLSPRSFNKLKRSGIETIEQITSLTQAEIKKL